MKCPYCGARNPITEGGFPDRCATCGAWFTLKDQIKDWQITLHMVRSCLDHMRLLGNQDCEEEHKECAQELGKMIQEMNQVIQRELAKR